jgi:outer membrane protein
MSRGIALTAAAVSLFAADAAHGAVETLQDAITAAYRTNPVLRSQREQQKALDETYVQAKVGWRPTAGVTGQANYARGPSDIADFGAGFSATNYGAAAVTLTQPLYTGGRTTWAVRAADASVAAGREDLRAVEEQVLLSVVQAFVDVLRDQQILAIRQADMTTLERQAAESKAKFDLGQVTRTDVAEAQAQLEAARGALAVASGQLETSRAEFETVAGEAPRDLSQPEDLPGMPANLEAALASAEASNPTLRQSREQERSSRAAVAQAKAAWRPTVALQGTYGWIGPVAPLSPREYGAEPAAAVTVSVPILTGGLVASQVREATARNSSDQIAIETVRRQVVQAVVQSWSELQSNRVAVAAAQSQTSAASLALQGAQAEYGFGLRTTLDVLIADQNLRAAQQTLAVSRHDAFLAEAAVLNAAGGLEARDLIPAEPLYEPRANFDRVKDKGAAPLEGVVETLDRIGAPAEP